MAYLKKKYFYRSIILVCLLFFFVSCGTFDYFKKSDGNNDHQTPEQIKIAQLESELSDSKENQVKLNDQIENKNTTIKKLKNNILKLEKIKTAKPVQYNIEYTHPSDLYTRARNLLLEDNFNDAITLFTEFIKNHPLNSLADNAVYWLGECHYSKGDYEKAILIFKDLVIKYPKSEKVPDSMLKTGYSYLSLDDTNRAHHYLKQVLKKYPFSPASEKAQEKIKSFE